MSEKQVPSPQQVAKAANAVSRRRSRLKAADYREAILILLGKNLSHEEISRFLRNEGVDINQTAISRYLRTHPPTQIEEQEVASKTPELDDPAESDALASAGLKPALRERLRDMPRKPRTEPEEDDTDYSFLNVQGRPFTITPRE